MFHSFLDKHKDRLPSDTLVSARRTLRVTGLGESDMDRRIADLYRELSNPEVTINFTPHDLEIHLTAKAGSLEQGEALMKPLVLEIEERLRGFLFSTEDESLPQVVVNRLGRAGLTLASAESVTGGLLAHQICSVPGASQVLKGSIVSYTEECKRALLGVRAETLEKYSAVSEEVAREMVEGLAERTGASLCLSSTGYAGPGGGTKNDPVGTVYIGFKSPEKTTVRRLSLPGSRNLVRSRAAQAMLFMVFRYLDKRY